MSHAPGLSGTPDSGHRSSAATSASCASSSARPTSRTIRARPAMSLADSILHTASMTRCVSGGTYSRHVDWLIVFAQLAKLALTVAGDAQELPGHFDSFGLRIRLQDRQA